MKYEKFNEDFEKEVYVSMAAEFKRNVLAKYSFKIVADNKKKEVFDFIVSKAVKGMMKENEINPNNIIIHENIGSKSVAAFVEKFKEGEMLEYRFRHDKDFYTIFIEVKEKSNGVLKIQFNRTVRRSTTVVGVNGRMGTSRFRREHKKGAFALEQLLRNKYM
ncbi:MAG: hypothetical protein KAG04_00330 [Mycoplasmataceae bacterium]|nr:hypothetical protein [Mycoplasmataceae bacterium]